MRRALERRCRAGYRSLALALSERFDAARKLVLAESKREMSWLGNLLWFQLAGHQHEGYKPCMRYQDVLPQSMFI